MGGACNYCNVTEAELCQRGETLEFHHLEPREWCTRDLSRWQRQTQYEREWEAGVIVPACPKCNKAQGEPGDTADAPF